MSIELTLSNEDLPKSNLGRHRGGAQGSHLQARASAPIVIDLEDRDEAAQAKQDAVRRDRRLKRGMTCVLVLLAVCATVVGVVWWQTRDNGENDNAVASGITDESGDEQVCNGLASNCNRRVNEIMYATVHNAMSSRDNNFVAYNNLETLEEALQAGFRALFMDSCDCPGLGVQLCHAFCTIGFRRPAGVFQSIVDFLEVNTTEVIIVEMQIGDQSFDGLWDKITQVESSSGNTNLTSLLYSHPNRTEEWPLLSELIANNTRLVLFQHDGPDCQEGECPVGMHNAYDHMIETPYDAEGLDGLMNVTYTCEFSRGRRSSKFVISNHFATNSIGLPDESIAASANLEINLQSRLDSCRQMLGRDINFLMVDFWSFGDVVSVVQKNNEILALTDAPTESPSTSPEPTMPGATASPTNPPTAAPTPSPTPAPTEATAAIEPTLAPTVDSTLMPTESDTSSPTLGSTNAGDESSARSGSSEGFLNVFGY